MTVHPHDTYVGEGLVANALLCNTQNSLLIHHNVPRVSHDILQMTHKLSDRLLVFADKVLTDAAVLAEPAGASPAPYTAAAAALRTEAQLIFPTTLEATPLDWCHGYIASYQAAATEEEQAVAEPTARRFGDKLSMYISTRSTTGVLSQDGGTAIGSIGPRPKEVTGLFQ